MNNIVANTQAPIALGRIVENQYTRVAFPIETYALEYPTAEFTLLNRRPNDALAYPVANIEKDDEYLYWNVTSSDLTVDGIGECEFVVTVDSVVAKSIIYVTKVLPALDGSGDVPDPWESWLTQFQQYANIASESAASATQSAQSADDSASTATSKAIEATNSAIAAASSADTASTKAGESANSATAASGSANTASQKAGEAAASATAASGSADSASVSAGSASANALKSEGFAVGQQNGEDVGVDSPYHENNAKYYSEQAAESAASAATHNMGVSISGTTIIFTSGT